MLIRGITKTDLPAVLFLMKDFASFDGSSDKLHIDVSGLNSAYFHLPIKLYGIVAEIEEEIVGFANYYFSYSSYALKPCLWVEDVFVSQIFRKKKVGYSLFTSLQKIAKEQNCERLEWLVRRDNNSGKDFYNKIGAFVDDNTIHVTWTAKLQGP